MGKAVIAEIDAEGIFTEPVSASFGSGNNQLNLSISGEDPWSAVVTVQRRFGASGDWVDVDTFMSNHEGQIIDNEEEVQYRAGIKVGDYTSGIPKVRLSK